VDAVSSPPSLRAATAREQDAIAGALLLIQAQARNELLRFPYRLARGDDCHEEPVELRLLMLLHDAVRRRLLQAQEDAQGGEDDPFADAQGDGAAGEDRLDRRAAARTEEVVAAGVERLMAVGYGEALARVLAKDGRQLEGGGVKLSGHDLKRMCKQCGILARGFVNGFGGVLSDEPLRAGLARLADLITFDVVSIMAAYHLRTVERGRLDSGAFEDGSEEQMLLKLHRRANELRRTLTDMWPGMELGGLAGATAPVLKAWVDKMARSIGSWIDAATAHETWMPAIHGTHHSVSLVDAFASAQQAAQTFAALRMGSQASVRTAFLELLGEVCTRYIFIMREAATREHAARATALAAAAGGAASAVQGGGRGWLLSVNAFKDDWNAMKNVIFEREGGLDESLDGSRAGDGQDEGNWGVDGLVGKMEHMADELTNVSKWGSNLKSLGRKSMSVSLSLGKKSLNVVTLGAVSSPGFSPANPAGRAAGACRDGVDIVVTPSDLYDGTLLVSEAGCTRISNASQVLPRLPSWLLSKAKFGFCTAACTLGCGVAYTAVGCPLVLTPAQAPRCLQHRWPRLMCQNRSTVCIFPYAAAVGLRPCGIPVPASGVTKTCVARGRCGSRWTPWCRSLSRPTRKTLRRQPESQVAGTCSWQTTGPYRRSSAPYTTASIPPSQTWLSTAVPKTIHLMLCILPHSVSCDTPGALSPLSGHRFATMFPPDSLYMCRAPGAFAPGLSARPWTLCLSPLLSAHARFACGGGAGGAGASATAAAGCGSHPRIPEGSCWCPAALGACRGISRGGGAAGGSRHKSASPPCSPRRPQLLPLLAGAQCVISVRFQGGVGVCVWTLVCRMVAVRGGIIVSERGIATWREHGAGCLTWACLEVISSQLIFMECLHKHRAEKCHEWKAQRSFPARLSLLKHLPSSPLQVVWLSALDALQSELHDTSLDVSDRVRHPRAAHVLRHLTTSIYADGAGLPLTLIHKSSAALIDILGPAASPPLQPS
jgi:hypothetical protein